MNNILPTCRLIVVLAFALFTASCAVMNEQECQAANWWDVGHEDATSGQTADISRYREACAEYGVAPVSDQYQLGYDDGLIDFCTLNKGYQFGRQGNSYQQTCPPHIEADFVQGYRQGRELYDVEYQLTNIEQKIESNFYRIERIHDDIYTLQERAHDNKLTQAERENYRLQVSNLRHQILQLRRDNRWLEQESYQLERKYRRLERKALDQHSSDYRSPNYRAPNYRSPSRRAPGFIPPY